jgi:hypothetical protein
MDYKRKRQIERINLKLNTFIMDILCYPINKIEQLFKLKIRSHKNKTHPNIYEYIKL